MTQIAVAPFVFKDALLKIGADNYEKHVSQAELRPDVKTEQHTWQSITPAGKFSEAGAPVTTWQLILSYAQDWETPNSLSEYLRANAGTVKSITLHPRAGVGKKTFTISATIVAGPIGGTGNNVATGTVTLACDGEPVPGTAA